MAGTEINIIKIDGKPLEKLIEVVSKGMGRLYQYHEIRKLADAEAYKLRTLAQAQAESDAATIVAQSSVQHLIQHRINHVEVARQLNLENVVYGAAEELRNEVDVSEEEVDRDWISRFFNIVQDISNDEIQIIWSKILAGEIKQPNSYSFRTLDLMRNLSVKDAKLFQVLANYVFIYGHSNYIYYKKVHKELKAKGFTYPHYLHLVDLGILSSNDSSITVEKGNSVRIYHGKYSIQISADDRDISLVMTPFTAIGNEMIRLVELRFNLEYFRMVCQSLRSIRDSNSRNICIITPHSVVQSVESYLQQG
jgi:uncharacterized repeat protein (TIGR03899 family)